MSLFNKVLFFFLIILILIGGLILCIGRGYFDQQIKNTLEHVLSTRGAVARITKLHVVGRSVTIENVDIKLSNNCHTSVNDLTVNLTLSSTNIIFKIAANEISLIDQSKTKVIQSKFDAEYSISLINFSSQAKILFDKINPDEFKDGKVTLLYSDNILNGMAIDCHAVLDKEANIEFISKSTKSLNKINKLHAKVNITKVPVTVYKLVERFIPDHAIIKFLQEYIKSGLISGVGELTLDEEFFSANKLSEKNLQGNFDIANMELRYDEYFPSLKRMNVNVSLLGPLIKLYIKQAYSSNTLISDGTVELNWTGALTSKVVISGFSKGPAVDLTDFIPRYSLQIAQKNGIDLRNIKGTANSKIVIIIPLNPNIKNSYNISSEISDLTLKMFNDNIKGEQFKVSGLFNGDQVIINGIGKINHYDSNIHYEYNFNHLAANEHLLRIKSKIDNVNNKIGIIRLNSGDAIFNFEYKVKNNHSTITLNSDLQNLDFLIDKISIHKPIGKVANLTIKGNLTSIDNGFIDFKLIGDNNLQILGNTQLRNGIVKTTLPVINHNNTNIKAMVVLDKKAISTKINGISLDLSKADMVQFLEKEQDADIGTELSVNVEKVLLKNNIKLDDVKLKIKCDSIKCYKGYFDSKIGSKFLKMLLKTFKDKEEWVVTSNNAGAVFKGIGIYQSMKAGKMILVLYTTRKEIAKGQVIPILDGTFSFKRFVITDAPFFVKFISLNSLFTNLITNTNRVAFFDMNGNLSYANNILKITNVLADGVNLDFIMNGTIDTKNHNLKLKGNVMPSFGISTIAKKIPIINKIISGAQSKVMLIPYSIEQKY